MYHFIKDISLAASKKDFNDVFAAILNNSEYEFLDEFLVFSYTSDFRITKKYDSRTTISLLNHCIFIENSRSVKLQDYLMHVVMSGPCLIKMINSGNFTEYDEMCARELLESLRQEDLIYLACEYSYYAVPYLFINDRYIPIFNIPDNEPEYFYKVPKVSHNNVQYTRFAKDISDNDKNNLYHNYYYYISKGHRLNTNVIDGCFILLLDDLEKSLEFIENMFGISSCATYIGTFSKNMHILKKLYPDAICTALDINVIDNKIRLWREKLFDKYNRTIWEHCPYEYFSRQFTDPNHIIQPFYSARPLTKRELDIERKICLYNLVYHGVTIFDTSLLSTNPELLRVYQTINRLKRLHKGFEDISILF